MTPKLGGRREDGSSHDQGGNNGDIKKLKKSIELLAVLEFLKNLRDAGVGTNHTENIVNNITNEINNKVGSRSNNNNNNNCNRDVDMIRNIMNIRISKLAKETRYAKGKMKTETKKAINKANNPQEKMREHEKIRAEILKIKERDWI